MPAAPANRAKPADDGEAEEKTLLYSMRTLKLPGEQTATEVVPTETLVNPMITSATFIPESLLTPTTLVENQSPTQEQVEPVESTNPISQLTSALLPVALLLLGVLTVVMLRVAQARDRR